MSLWYVREQADLDRLVEELTPVQRFGLDIETQGLDPLTKKILLIAFSWKVDGVMKTAVVRRYGLDLSGLKRVLESPTALKLIHHSKFEIAMFYAQEGILLARTYCTMLVEHMVNDGRVDGFGLDVIEWRRLGIRRENKKEMQHSFIDAPEDSEFTPEQVAYAAEDTTSLHDIADQQYAELRDMGADVLKLMKTEFDLTPILARMELEGLCVDEERWRAHLAKLQALKEPLEPEVKAALTPILREKYDNLWKLAQADYAGRVKDMAAAELASYYEGPVQNKTKKDRLAFEAQWLPVINGQAVVDDVGSLPRTVMSAIHRVFAAEADAESEKRNKRTKDGKLLRIKPIQENVKALWTKLAELDDDGINLASVQQTIEAYRLSGINVGIDGMELHQIETDDDGNFKNSVDADALAGAIAFMDNRPQFTALIAATKKFLTLKKLEKQLKTYGQSMLDLRSKLTQRLHTDYQQIGSKGGRLSARKPNVMNIPNRGEQTIYRTFFIAPPKHVLIKADFSQIELRIAAEITGDPKMIESYLNGLDIHSQTASLLTSIAYEDIVARKETDQYIKDQRSGAKIVNFGIGYGMTKYGLATQTGWPLDRCEEFIARHLAVYAVLAKRMDDLGNLGLNRGYAETLGKRRLYFRRPDPTDPEVKWKRRRIYRQARNAPIQGTNADITKTAGVWIARDLEPYCTRQVGRWVLPTRHPGVQYLAGQWVDPGGFLKQAAHADELTADQIVAMLPEGVVAFPANFVHDEIVVVAPHGKADEVADIVKKRMIEAGELWVKKVPVEVDVHVGATWGG